jgi:hypothetical protein
MTALMLIFVRCSKDEEKDYYSVLGTAHVTNDSIIIVGDDDVRYLINDPNSTLLSEIDEEDRLIVYFSFSNETKPVGIDFVIDVYDAVRVLYKPMVILTESNADTIGHDPLHVTDIWIAKNYLNMNFEYYGYSIRHFINLIRYPGDITGKDTVEVEIRHNQNDDNSNYLMSGFVTFDISSLQGLPGDSVTLHIKAKEYDNHNYDEYKVYKF